MKKRTFRMFCRISSLLYGSFAKETYNFPYAYRFGALYYSYGVATIKIIGLFCRISSLLYGSFAKETYNFPYAYRLGALYYSYGVATGSRLLKIISLFCKRAL